MKRGRTFNTLFLLESLDGKISTGESDKRDMDKDLPRIKGIKEGLQQYYALERKTDSHSLNTGRVMSKIGVNTNKNPIKGLPVSFIILDNNYLKKQGVLNLINNTKKLYLITSNKNHPAFKFKDRLELIYYPKKVVFSDLFKRLKKKYKIDKITIQSGGNLNSILSRKGLIDRVSLVIAPALVGGSNTSTLIDGKSLFSDKDLKKIKALKLKTYKKLKNSYLHLVYDVLN
ncbi:dihydrofolate reductase family protein [Nanoarchaeota archaeon]